MSRLPSLRPRQVIAALRRVGFQETRQSGSHLRLKHPDGREVVVPVHNKELRRSTLMSIVSQAGYSAEEFKDLL